MIKWLEPSIQASIDNTAAQVDTTLGAPLISMVLNLMKEPTINQQAIENEISTVMYSIVEIAYRTGFEFGTKLK